MILQFTIKFELWFGLIFTLITLLVIDLLLVFYNAFTSENSKIPKIIFKNTRSQAAITSLGIWGLQLIVLGGFFTLFVPIYLYFLFAVIYVGFYYLFLKKNTQKTISASFETIEARLEQKHQRELEQLERTKEEHTILEVKDLRTYFYTEEGIVRAVEGVSFKIYENEVLGLVGETGCGKSVTALSILQLVKSPGKIIQGEIIFEEEDLLQKSKSEILGYRGNKITMMFQDPLNSLNPVFKTGDQVIEVLLLHKEEELLAESKKRYQLAESLRDKLSNTQDELLKSELNQRLKSTRSNSSIYAIAREWAIDIIDKVGIADPEKIVDRYPFELSGGMRQRIMIAMGLSCSPKLLLADEPTTALDVTIQAQILDLLRGLTAEFGTSILMITHDLGIIADLCDRVAVMYSGSIVESGDVIPLFKNPQHPYTQGLMAAIPVVGKKKDNLQTIRGVVPNLIYPPAGCRFHPRCDHCFEPCDHKMPPTFEIQPGYFVACHLFDPKYKKQLKNEGDLSE
jgi:peptide/nickel transport system ATP-binding protein